VLASSSTGNEQALTEFVYILDDDVFPEKHFLEAPTGPAAPSRVALRAWLRLLPGSV
jgi:hypothetical protein